MDGLKPKLSIGFNGKVDDLRQIIATGDNIESVYSGGLRNIIAGGRPQYADSLTEISQCISLAHQNGIHYEIALNAPCGLHDKSDTGWWTQIEDYLLTLEELGADRIVASHPFLISLVKKKTHMEAVVSTICEITEARMAKYYEDMGADIIIPSMNINYRLEKLIEMKHSLKNAKMRIMVNEHCLGDCPWRRFHHSHYAHSNTEHDYHANCKRKFLEEPYLCLTNNAIRPEDLIRYHQITDNFKIVGRLVSISCLIDRINAYSTQKYNGNFVFLQDENLSEYIYVSNKELNDLFDRKRKCKFNCSECNACKYLYEKASVLSNNIIC
ncbi:MAG: U32 family peptidase [Clostridia bacterium]|nr:U32 family peptidase [Clostridia bacterium]